MATFLTTIRFTDQGFKNIGETTRRAAAIRTMAQKVGAEVKETYWTLGESDGLLIFEAPDDETASVLLMQIGAQGNVHTTTSRAFRSDEVDRLLARAIGG